MQSPAELEARQSALPKQLHLHRVLKVKFSLENTELTLVHSVRMRTGSKWPGMTALAQLLA